MRLPFVRVRSPSSVQQVTTGCGPSIAVPKGYGYGCYLVSGICEVHHSQRMEWQ